MDGKLQFRWLVLLSDSGGFLCCKALPLAAVALILALLSAVVVGVAVAVAVVAVLPWLVVIRCWPSFPQKRPRFFSQSQAHALVAERAGKKRRLRHAREILLRVHSEQVGGDRGHVETGAVAHLIQIELQAEVAFDLDREVAKDEEGPVAIVSIFQSVQRGHQRSCQCGSKRSGRQSSTICRSYEATRHEKVGTWG